MIFLMKKVQKVLPVILVLLMLMSILNVGVAFAEDNEENSISEVLSSTVTEKPDISELSSSKQTLSDSEKKLSSRILQLTDNKFLLDGMSQNELVNQMEEQHQIEIVPVTHNKDGKSSGLNVYVYIKLAKGSDSDILLPYVSQVANKDEGFGLVAAWVDIDSIDSIASLDEVESIKEVMPPMSDSGSVTSEGDELLKSNLLRDQTGADGTGIKIGIISDGVDNRAESIESKDLPATLTVLSNTIGGDEGTAMLEIVHDLAPGAELYFHDAGSSVLDFNDAIDALISAGCDVICDDVAWPSEPYFEDGIIAQHVESVLDSNDIVYAASAGNYAQRHYQSLYYDDGHGWNDFSRGENSSYPDLYAEIPAGGSITAVLQWNDSFGSSGNNYDLVLFNTNTSDILAESAIVQDGNDDPIEAINYVNNSESSITVAVAVAKRDAAVDKIIEVYIWNAATYSNNIIAADSIFGHKAVPDLIACGAIHPSRQKFIADYSSRGPVTMLTEKRKKPDICGAAGVKVTGAGGFGQYDSGNYYFYGTSAAAPHIAAIAGLLRSRFPSMSASQIRQLILDNGIDLGCSGHDSMFGYGRSNALASALEYMHVDFNSMGGSAVNSQLISYNEKITKPTNPSKQGLALVGWYKEEACTNEWNFAVDHVLTDITLYAKWGPPCEVTFNSMGGSAIDSQTIGQGGKVVHPEEPTNAGYVLLGWYEDEACTTQWDFDNDVVTGDMTLYALWGETLDGSGTEGDPYLIDNATNLLFLAHMVNTSNAEFFDNKYYLQTADIDLSSYNKCTPIGWKTTFNSTYDGAGYTISGININVDTDNLDSSTFLTGKIGIGLFGRVEGVIKNVHLAGGKITVSGKSEPHVGGIAGYVDNGTIENCSSSVDILGSGGTCNVGGIVGSMYKCSKVIQCNNSGSISAQGNDIKIGGITGKSYDNYSSLHTISDCRNTGKLSSTGSGYDLYIGGIAGKAEDTDFSNCENSQSIIVLSKQENGRHVSGIVGQLSARGSLTDCANTGDITCDNTWSMNIGGLVGDTVSDNAKITRCYNTGNIYILSGNYISAGGIAGRASSSSDYSNFDITECYNAGDILVENPGYRTWIGGLLASNSSPEGSDISDCFNWGKIGCPDSAGQDDIEHIGGLVGYVSSAETTFANCYNTAEISETGYFGGIAGEIPEDASSFSNCYYADTCSIGVSKGYDAGSSQTVAALKQQATFSGYDFTNTWEINESFPVLQNLSIAAVSGVSIDESLDLKVGEMAILTLDVVPSNALKQVSWSSSNESVVSVSGGVVRAVGKGTATITVTTKEGGFTDTCSVTVIQPATGVSLNKSTCDMLVGQTDTLTATVEPSDALNKNITWSSSNESVATIADGVVTSFAEGCAIITVTTEDGGFTDTCAVNVIVPQIIDGQLHYIYYNPDSSISREVIYYGVNDSSNIQKINYYTDGIRTSYRLFNESGNLKNLVELYSGGQTKKINYYNTSSGNRYAYKLYDTSGRMTHYIFTYSNGIKPEKTNYYDVVTGKRTSYKLYDTQGRTTHLISCHPDGAKPEKTNYYNVSTGIRTSYKLYDTKGRTTRYAICYSDGVKAKKMNYYNVNTGIRWGYKTYRTNGTCSCYVKCDSEGKPSVATYYDEDGNVTKVERY